MGEKRYGRVCSLCHSEKRLYFLGGSLGGSALCNECEGKGWVYVDNPEKRSDKMKLSEVIKELEKDGTKIFVSKNKAFVEMKCQTKYGSIEFYRDTSIYTGDIGLDREWEEILQPITFEEVLNKGKLFKCKHPKIKEEGYWVLSRFIEMLSIKGFTSSEIIDILKNGKFYN